MEINDGVKNETIPKIKLSENVGKIINPGSKKTWCFFGRESGKALADLFTRYDETVDGGKPGELFDPEYT